VYGVAVAVVEAGFQVRETLQLAELAVVVVLDQV
jgi:hypothetical protein